MKFCNKIELLKTNACRTTLVFNIIRYISLLNTLNVFWAYQVVDWSFLKLYNSFFINLEFSFKSHITYFKMFSSKFLTVIFGGRRDWTLSLNEIPEVEKRLALGMKGVEVCRISGWEMHRFLKEELKGLKTDSILILVVPVTSKATLGGCCSPSNFIYYSARWGKWSLPHAQLSSCRENKCPCDRPEAFCICKRC